MRLPCTGAVLLMALVAVSAAEEAKKAETKKEAEPKATEGKELIMLELERVTDSRDKRQTEEEAAFANKEVPPEYLSLLQQLQLQGGEAPQPAPGQLDPQGVQQYYIAKTPQGVISGGPLDRSPQRFLPSPGEPRPFRPRDPVLNAISRQNSALQAEYQRKAIRDQETVFLMPRGPVGADPPRAGPLALAGLYRPGAQPPQPSQGVPVAPGQAVGLAQPPVGLQAYSAHDARLRAALQGAEVIPAPSASPQPQFISPQYVQQLQARGLAALGGGPASELGLVREAAQQLQRGQPVQLQRAPPLQLQPAPRPQPQLQQLQQQQLQQQQLQQQQPQNFRFQELSPAELRFVQRQQAEENAPPPGPRYVLQPNPQQLQAQLDSQQAQQLQAQFDSQQAQQQNEEQYLRETTPGGPPPLPVAPVRAIPQPQPQHPGVLQPSPLYLQQVQQLAEQQALARHQLAAQQQLQQQQQQQQQQPTEEVTYIRQPQRYAAAAPPVRAAPAPTPQPAVAHTTPRSSIYVSTAKAQAQAQAASLRSRPVTIEQLLSAGEVDLPQGPKGGSLPVVRLPAGPKTLTQADLQQLIDAGFDVSPVADPRGQRDPTSTAYYRSSAAGDYQGQPIVVPESEQADQIPRLSPRQRQALLQAQAQEEAYLQSRGVRLSSQ